MGLSELAQARVAQVQAHFEAIHATSMKDMPINNPAISVEAYGFRAIDDTMLMGVLIAPWTMNWLRLPMMYEEEQCVMGTQIDVRLADGVYPFHHAFAPEIGRYESCSLESPLTSADSQALARAIADEVMKLLDKKQARAPSSMDRRGFLTGRRV